MDCVCVGMPAPRTRLVTSGLSSGRSPDHCWEGAQGAVLLHQNLLVVLPVGVLRVPVYVPGVRVRREQPQAEQTHPASQRDGGSGRVLLRHHDLEGPALYRDFKRFYTNLNKTLLQKNFLLFWNLLYNQQLGAPQILSGSGSFWQQKRTFHQF